MRLTLIGLVIGLVGTFVITDVLSSMLYGIAARDPLTIVVAGVVLAGMAGLACFVPAWRMTRLDPMEALRRP
jgi:ABC-type antimicrobial peptide transport system permease subunit